MSLGSATSRNNYTGNGAVSTYSYTFKIFEESDLLVTVRNTLDVETTLVLTTDYTVAGEGLTAGGSISLVNSGQAWLTAGKLTTGYVISIRRVRPLTQETDIRNQGSFFPETHEDAFDHLVMIGQQHQDEIDRSIKLAESIDPADFDPTMPSTIVGQDGVSIITNPAGDGFIEGPTADEIDAAQGYATAASNSATASAASASASAASAVSAAASASSVLAAIPFRDVVYKVFADSPVTVTNSDAGKLFVFDCTGGAISVNLPLISTMTSIPPTFGFKKTDAGVNKVTINRAGSDTIATATTLLLESQNSASILVADTDASPDDWTPLSFGGATGVGGQSIKWSEQALAPIKEQANNVEAWGFSDGNTEYLYTFIKVPNNYVVGGQIRLRSHFYTTVTSGTVLIQSLATLIRVGTDAVTSTTNQRTSTNSATTVNGTAEVATAVTLDLTSSTGTINSVAVSAGDLIFVRITRDYTTDTAAATAYLLADSSEVTFL
jgi:hypothetical protein